MVQGVGFRYSTIHKAKSLGIKGYVKNMYDGSVYIEAEGNNENIKEFVSWCRQGPSHARVSNIVVNDGEVNNFKYFDVKY